MGVFAQVVCAGNYLRVRGEYGYRFVSSVCYMELPPRARRIQFMPSDYDLRGGTTSACAENTPLGDDGFTSPGNYLRVRGEYFSF